MFDFLIQVSAWSLPMFVFATMLNVGLTQNLSRIVSYYRNWRFYKRMLFANFVLSPGLMLFLLRIADLSMEMSAALTIFSLCAGAPFLIKLTQNSKNDMALGASLMVVLVIGTVIFMPILLPALVPGIRIDGMAVAWSLTKQLLLPIAIGLVLAQLLPTLMEKIQPWVAKLGSIFLIVLLVSTVIGYWPHMKFIVGTGALLVGLFYIIGTFFTGFFLGGKYGEDSLEDIGGLGTAQRNTAASMLIAAQNFSEQPTVLVLITLVNIIGLIFLLVTSKYLSRDHQIEIADTKM